MLQPGQGPPPGGSPGGPNSQEDKTYLVIAIIVLSMAFLISLVLIFCRYRKFKKSLVSRECDFKVIVSA
jgi:hypothetical protein